MIEAGAGEPGFRVAVRGDVPDIVRMLVDDILGAAREEYASPLPEGYYTAFEAIDRDPNNELIVVEPGRTPFASTCRWASSRRTRG